MQGTFLGSLLLFISLLPDTVSSCSSLFADDCLLYKNNENDPNNESTSG